MPYFCRHSTDFRVYLVAIYAQISLKAFFFTFICENSFLRCFLEQVCYRVVSEWIGNGLSNI